MRMNSKSVYKILVAFLSVIGCFQLFTFSKKVVELNFENTLFYAAKSHNLPAEVHFCGEAMPLDSRDIQERLDKEIIKNTYWHSSILLYYKRAGKYFPIIEPILRKNGIPNDFKYLVIAESGLKNVVSPAGARGFWQFMEKTGKEYGLEINKEVDERYDLEKSTHAACDYLNDAFKKFNSWTLVAASYNMGMYGLEKNLKRQKVKSYYDLLLNSETSRYVFRIVTFKLILENPSYYGFNLKEENRYPPLKFRTVEVDSAINSLADFAISQKSNYKILRISNPWLRQRYLKNPNKRKYKLKFPTEGYNIYTEYVCEDPDSIKDSVQLEINKTMCADSISKSNNDSLVPEKILNSDTLKSGSSIEKSQP